MDRPRQRDTRPTDRARTRAKELRRDLSTPEVVLWSRLRRGQILGFKFRRQHPIGPYVADFYCHEAAMVVETDSGWHASPERQERDQERDDWMRERGIATVRITAGWLARDEDGAVTHVAKAAIARIKELGGVPPQRTPSDPRGASDHLPRLRGGGGGQDESAAS